MIGIIILAVFALLSLGLPALAAFGFLSPVLYLMASLGTGMLMVVTMVVVFMFTRGVLEPALMARMKGQALWIVITATRRFRLVPGKTEQRLFRAGDEGDYLIDPEASYMWPHGVSGSVAVATRGTSLNPDLVQAASNMKEAGIRTNAEMEAVYAELAAQGKDVEILPEEQSVVGRPLRFGDVVDFFKYNLNPSYIQSTIKMSVARGLEGRKEFPVQIVLTMGILLICAGIAYLIIIGAQSSNTAATQLGACQGQLGSCLQQAGKVVTGAAATTTTVPSMPGIIPGVTLTPPGLS